MTDADASLESEDLPRGGHAHVEMIRQAVHVYRSGDTGIAYQILADFAVPIIEHFQLDLDPRVDACVTAANAGEMAEQLRRCCMNEFGKTALC